MRIRELFIKSLYSLKAISFFRFQKIERTISYLFILSFLVSLPTLSLFFYSFFTGIKNNNLESFGNTLQGFSDSQINELEGSMAGMIPVFIFLTVLFIFLGVAMVQFITVSLLATIGLPIKRALHRRLDYKQLWNISAYAVTLPGVIIGISVLLPFSIPAPFFIYFILSVIIVFIAIRKVPIPKTKK